MEELKGAVWHLGKSVKFVTLVMYSTLRLFTCLLIAIFDAFLNIVMAVGHTFMTTKLHLLLREIK